MKLNISKFCFYKHLSIPAGAVIVILSIALLQSGCRSPEEYRTDVDKTTSQIITQKQVQAVGKTSEFEIERPSDLLRKRLLIDQNLPFFSPASLGTAALKKPQNWPEPNYPADDPNITPPQLTLTLIDALQIGARNNFNYQSQKENVFRSALDLELERDSFRNTFFSQVDTLVSIDTTGNRTISGSVVSSDASVNRKLKNGAELSSAIAVDLANLFTLGGASSMGLAGDATIAVPLLRGSGEFVVTEPLTQAERNVIYAIWDFEQFKKDFAVDLATRYLSVLQRLDGVKNSESDYGSRITSARRTRRLADAGKVDEIQVDQAVQNELSSRQRWISATQSYKKQLDSFKTFLGLPPDAVIELDPNELVTLRAPTDKIIEQIIQQQEHRDNIKVPPADSPVELAEPDYENAGPYEINEDRAILLGLENRLDLKTADGLVYDAQRVVIIAADALGAELTFFGSAQFGSRRTVRTADLEDAKLRTDKGVYPALLTLDLPFERTWESLNYRDSFITLERAVRNVQSLEDVIKLDIINDLRDLLEARENVYIQAEAVYVAQKRVRSATMFLEAGRKEIRDLLEAQDALLGAQNALTAAVVAYRVTELAIQRDMGLLDVNEKGLWKEYLPGDDRDVKEENISDS
ncbi:MAG: TolC family protein [Phycisphaerae bacterium]|nr:TolC family protein [Phycisphaerae bacterium]